MLLNPTYPMVAEKAYTRRNKPEKRQLCLIMHLVTFVPMEKDRSIATRIFIVLMMPPEGEKCGK